MATSCLVSALALAQPAMANPTGGTVVSGQATIIAQSSQSTLVQQNSQKAIITWQSLNLAGNQSLTFVQPNAQAIALNRVLSNSSSVINGTLSANGQVWIINPNGVVFGSGASVNVAGLLATTSDIANQDFLSGTYNFSQASLNPLASVINQGNITALSGGSVILAGNQVANQGVIQAQLGTVVLAGAKTYAVDFYGDKLLSFAIDGGVDQLPKDANGNPVGWVVSNSGTIAAQGGNVTMTARAANSVLDHLINMSGQIQATAVSVHNGTVVLDAGDGGGIDVSGKIDASGGGGSVKIGGPTAGTVSIDTGAVIDATGGTVETSGHDLLLGKATVKASSWLIDPDDFIIDATAASAIDTALTVGAVVTIQTGTVGVSSGTTAVSGSGGGTNGDIFVNSPISWSGPGALTLDAANNISINASISHTGTATGNLSLITGDTASTGIGGGGNYVIGSGASITLVGADNLSINNNNYTLITAGSQFATLDANTNYALANSLTGAASVSVGMTGAYASTFAGFGNSVNLALTSGNGLFATVSGAVRDLTLGGSLAVSGVASVGAVAGSLSGTVSNVASSAAVSALGASSYVGGIVGNINGGTITNATFSGTVSVGDGASFIGGIAGFYQNAGGSINNVANSGGTVLAGNSVSYVGGLIGQAPGGNSSGGTVTSAYISVGDSASYIGGAFGYQANFASASVLATTVIAGASATMVGGVAGWGGYHYLTLGNVDVSVSVGANSSTVGGVVGYMPNDDGIIKNYTVTPTTVLSLGDNVTAAGGFAGAFDMPGGLNRDRKAHV